MNETPELKRKNTAFDYQVSSSDITEFVRNHRESFVSLNAKEIDNSIIDRWSEIRLKNAPQRRAFHSHFLKDNTFYIVGGINTLDEKLNDVMRVELDSEVGTWEKLELSGDMPYISHHNGALINSKYYFMGGSDFEAEQIGSIYCLDLDNMSVSNIPLDSQDLKYASMFTVNSYGDDLYIFGGFINKEYSAELFKINLTTAKVTRIQPKSDKPRSRILHASLIINGDLIVFGGLESDGTYLNDIWKFSIGDEIWTQLATEARWQPKARAGHSMTVRGDEIYIFGGKIGILVETNELLYFNLKTEQFSQINDIVFEMLDPKLKQSYVKVSIHEQATRQSLVKKKEPAWRQAKSDNKAHMREK